MKAKKTTKEDQDKIHEVTVNLATAEEINMGAAVEAGLSNYLPFPTGLPFKHSHWTLYQMDT